MGGIVAFCTAAFEGDVQEMRRLVAGGLDPNTKDYDGRTALHLAASEGRLHALRYLLQLKVNVNPTDRWGNTPLDDALRKEHSSLVSMLTEHGGKRKQSQRDAQNIS